MSSTARSVAKRVAAGLVVAMALGMSSAPAQASGPIYAPYSSDVHSSDSAPYASTVAYSVKTTGGGTINPGGTVTVSGVVVDTSANGHCADAYARTTDFQNGGGSVVRRVRLARACGYGTSKSFSVTFARASSGVIDYVDVQAVRSDGLYGKYGPSVVTGSIID